MYYFACHRYFSEVFCSQNHLSVAQESSISGGSNKSFTMNYYTTWHTEGASHGDLYASSQANRVLPCNKETTYFDINTRQRDYEVLLDVWSASISYLNEKLILILIHQREMVKIDVSHPCVLNTTRKIFQSLFTGYAPLGGSEITDKQIDKIEKLGTK